MGMCKETEENISIRERVVSAILQAMRDGDAPIRCLAIKGLGSMKAREAAGLLIDFLKDHDPDVRSDAAASLGEIGDSQAVPALIESLKDEDGQVRLSAICALSSLGDNKCVEALSNAMFSKEDFYYDLGSELSGNYRWEIKEKTAQALGRLGGKRAVDALLEFLKDEDAEMSFGAILQAMIEMGEKRGIEAVAGYLKDPDPAVRRKAAKAFVYAKAVDALDYLSEALIDEDSFVKINAIEAIGRLGNEKYIVPLVLLLKDRDNSVRIKAIEALGRLGGEKAISRIGPLLHDPDCEIRRKTAETLGNIANSDSVELLIKALKDSDEMVCSEAVISIGKIADERAVEPLIAILKNKEKDAGLRRKAIFALGRLKGGEGLNALLEIIKDEEDDSKVKDMAFQALPMFDERKAVDCIKEMLNEADAAIKKGIAHALRDFKILEAGYILVSLLNDENEMVRREAAISLAYKGSDVGLDILASIIKNGDGEGRAQIFDAIRNISSEKVNELLVEGLTSEDHLCMCGAVRTIGLMGKKEFLETVIKLLKDEEKEVRREAVNALGRLGDRAALMPLLSALYDLEGFYDLRREIVAAIKMIDTEETVEILLNRLSDKEDKTNHWIAIEALSDLFIL